MNPTIVGRSKEHCGVTYGDLPVLYLNGKMLLYEVLYILDGKDVQQEFRRGRGKSCPLIKGKGDCDSL